MMKNIAVSAAAVAVCASTTGVMASVAASDAPVDTTGGKEAGVEKQAEGEPKSWRSRIFGSGKKGEKDAAAKGTQESSTADEKNDEVAKGKKVSSADALQNKKKQAWKALKNKNKGTWIIQPNEGSRFALAPAGASTYDSVEETEESGRIQQLEDNNGHFVDLDGKYWRFRTRHSLVEEDGAPAEAVDASAVDAEATGTDTVAAPKKQNKFELEVREAPTVGNMWRLLSKDNWRTVDESNNFVQGTWKVKLGSVVLAHKPRTYTARFLQIFFGFQQHLVWAMFKLACWLGAIYAALHFTVLKRAAVSDDEEEGTSCMSDSEEGESDSDVEDLESQLGESIRSGSVRASQASVRSGSVKSSQA